MRTPAKAMVVTLVSLVTLAFGIAPANALPSTSAKFEELAAVQPAAASQSLSANSNSIETKALDTLLELSDYGKAPHNFDVEATIALAESEVGTSRATGWSQPGECIMSAQRWIRAGGGAWGGGGNPVSNYDGATRVTLATAEPGDIIQYEYIDSPTSWVTGVHTVLITEVHDDGTFTIIESNNPGGSGLVGKNESWTPEPPAGFQAAVWRF